MNPRKQPKIIAAFDNDERNEHFHCNEIILNILDWILPAHLLDPSLAPDLDLKEELLSRLPIFYSSQNCNIPGTKTFITLSRHRYCCFKFFFEMISKWLMPGKRANVVLVYGADFKMPEICPNEIFTVCKILIHVDSQAELVEIDKNLPIIESEIKLGMESAYYARKILELKGLTIEEKIVDIQEHMTHLVKRLPNHFDHDLFSEMQQVLLTCPEEFKAQRFSLHLSKVVSIHYLFRKSLREAVRKEPEKRHLALKIFKSKISRKSEQSNVLSILVGVNFLGSKEVFEERHLLKAIKCYLPQVQSIEGSFFSNKRGSENIITVYLEVEKLTGEEFTTQEIEFLKKELPLDLKDRIEQMMHPLFMPRNEEEIMRNILSLSSQIKFLRDEAQVFISFDEQTHANLFFTVIVVRVVAPGAESLQELFNREPTRLKYIHDRCKMVGLLRKKYAKEATVFRVKIPSELFLRADHSIDLNRARQTVVNEMTKVIGEFRDFNGGMITKQNESLSGLRDLLQDSAKYNELLLENFFYSVNPVIMRSILPSQALKKLFEMILEEIGLNLFSYENHKINIQVTEEFVMALLVINERNLREEVTKNLHIFQDQNNLAHCFIQVYEIPCLGFIYKYQNVQLKEQFIDRIEQTIEEWDHKKQKVNYLTTV